MCPFFIIFFGLGLALKMAREIKIHIQPLNSEGCEGFTIWALQYQIFLLGFGVRRSFFLVPKNQGVFSLCF